MLSLITDRTSTDVDYAVYLWQKITGLGWSSLTASEQSEWLAGLKGMYDNDDLNRVGNAISYLAGLLNSYSYPVAVNPKTDWTASDIPSAVQMAALLVDLTAVKNCFYGTTTLPAAMDYITHTDANNIELLLIEIETYITNMVAEFQKSGIAKCGTEVIL